MLNVRFPLFLLVVLVLQTILVTAIVNLNFEYVNYCDGKDDEKETTDPLQRLCPACLTFEAMKGLRDAG